MKVPLDVKTNAKHHDRDSSIYYIEMISPDTGVRIVREQR